LRGVFPIGFVSVGREAKDFLVVEDVVEGKECKADEDVVGFSRRFAEVPRVFPPLDSEGFVVEVFFLISIEPDFCFVDDGGALSKAASDGASVLVVSSSVLTRMEEGVFFEGKVALFDEIGGFLEFLANLLCVLNFAWVKFPVVCVSDGSILVFLVELDAVDLVKVV
jgi:hypothetical protein